MDKLKIACVGIILFFFMLLPQTGLAAEMTVDVQIADFPIMLNGIQIDNVYRQYPFLICQGVVYFPLTYYDCRFLGMESDYQKQNDVVIIEDQNISCGYRPYLQKNKNNVHKKYQAAVSETPFTVNGKDICFQDSPTPFLKFRNVNYLPLTKDMTEQVLTWEYQFDEKKGLVINSHNPVARPLQLKNMYQNNEQGNILVMHDQLLYFTKEHTLFHAPLNQPQKAESVKMYEQGVLQDYEKTVTGLYEPGTVTLSKQPNGGYYLHDDYGWGNIMGIVENWPIHNDYTLEQSEMLGGVEGTFWHYDGVRVNIDQILSIDDHGQGHGSPKGNFYFHYGEPQESQLIGRKLYIIATTDVYNVSECRLYCYDLDTEEFQQVGSSKVRSFQILGETAYVADRAGRLLAIDLRTGTEKDLSIQLNQSEERYYTDDNKLAYPICAAGDRLYYVKNNGKLYSLNNPMGYEAANVTNLMNIDGNLVVQFEEKPENPCRFLVINQAGEIVYRSADVVQAVSIDGKQMVYQSGEQLFHVVL